MCLHSVGRFVPARKAGVGWKVFQVLPSGRLTGLFVSGPILAVNRWLGAYDAKKDPKLCGRIAEVDYEPGFHVFLDEGDAVDECLDMQDDVDKYVVRRVKFRGASIQGVYESKDCVVCKEILIEPLSRYSGDAVEIALLCGVE